MSIGHPPQVSHIIVHSSHAVIFFIFVLPYMGHHMSWAYVVLSAVLVAFVMAMLCMTAFRDPGFYPRSPPNSDVEFG